MTGLLARVMRNRQVLRGLVARNLREKYSGSFLGIFWALLNPLLLTAVIAFVFTTVLRADMPRFHVFVLSGLLPWFFFVNSVTECAGCYRQNRQLMNRFVFPRELIPLSVTAANFLNFLIGLAIVFPFFVYRCGHPLSPLLLLPAVMALHFVFVLGTALVFSTFTVYVRDIAQLLTVATMFLFWATPVFYPVSLIPPGARWVVDLNPAAGFIHLYHALLYDGSAGDPGTWAVSASWALAMICAGYSVFLRREHDFVKVV